MKIFEGERPGTVRLVPSDAGAELVVSGLAVEELAAAFGQCRPPRSWARERRIRVAIPGDDAATVCEETEPSLEKTFEDGTVRLHTGRPAWVQVEPTDEEPEFPMPKCLMLAIAHQWARLGRITLHAAAIEFEGTGLLVLGRSGAGKTTLSLAAIAAGGRIVSDDWLMLREESGALWCVALRDQLLVRHGPATETLLQHAGPRMSAGAETGEKRWFAGQAGTTMLDSMKCDGIVALRAGDRRTADRTQHERLAQAALYAEIVNSTSALLLSNRLGDDAATVREHVLRLTRLPAIGAVSGRDLIESPNIVLKDMRALLQRGRRPEQTYVTD